MLLLLSLASFLFLELASTFLPLPTTFPPFCSLPTLGMLSRLHYCSLKIKRNAPRMAGVNRMDLAKGGYCVIVGERVK